MLERLALADDDSPNDIDAIVVQSKSSMSKPKTNSLISEPLVERIKSKKKRKGKKRGKKQKQTEPAGAPTAEAPMAMVSTVDRLAPHIEPIKSRSDAQPQPQAEGSNSQKPAEGESHTDGGGTESKPPHDDFDEFARNISLLVEETGKAVAAYFKPSSGRTSPEATQLVEDAMKTLGQVAEYWLSDPARALEAQGRLSQDFVSLWAHTLRRFYGLETSSSTPVDTTDKRFADPDWGRNPLFDFIRQAYALSSRWANDLVERADIDDRTREKAQFYVRQLVSALSPSNFLPTNPELIRETIRQKGENLVRGMRMLAEDVEAGKGRLKIRQTNAEGLKLGVDMAATPGKVVFRNDLIELIQYEPTTPTVFKRPLLITPPWINKFYILDLNPDKSFVRWAVSQGLTVFMISWVNPDERHANKGFEDYIEEGLVAALNAVEAATGERDVSVIGYCVGGTLLATALALMAQTGDNRIADATFFTTQVDFKDSGDLKLFIDEARLKALEESMAERGYLEGSHMASAFNMLRPTELFWNYFVENYLKGKDPAPFDLLAWNSDSTRMPAANHSFYLRNCYLENNLARGEMQLRGHRLDLSQISIPIYSLATKEDHIAPARSVFVGSQLFGGPTRFVLAGSGHIAGVVNPVSKPKYQYWIGPDPAGLSFEDWLNSAEQHSGTWWTDWIAWVTNRAPEKVPARMPGGGKLTPLCDAPGDYVRIKA